jgi:hypothetical protein
MKLVIIESPYAGDFPGDWKTVERNITYARRAMRDSVHQGEAPIASHLLYTQEGILDDLTEEERNLGIEAGLAWRNVSDYSCFYLDYGWSRGMLAAQALYDREKRLYFERKIGLNLA